MLRNYFKIARRNLVRNKVYSAINIGGLAVGMAVAMLIGLWVYDELSFDTYHQNYRRLAQVMDTQTFNGEATTSEAVAIPLADKLRTDYGSAFKRMALVFPSFPRILAVGDKQVTQPGVWVQPDLPEMLSFMMLKGQRNALNDPSSALLAQSLAKALFGDTDPMGKTIKLDNRTYLNVGGVFQDLPRNTTFHDTKLFLPWAKAVNDLAWVKEAQNQWSTQHWRLFVELNESVDLGKLNAQIKDIAKPHRPENKPEIYLHPMADWHLHSEFRNGQVVGGRIEFVWLFGIIGGFVLLLACINFMNLSTARSEKRAKEVGIRKAVGSRRGQLIAQFFGESLLVATLAFLLALLIVQAGLPFFNELTDKTIAVPWGSPFFWLTALGFTLFTGLIAGSYPALYLSGFAPVKVLKGILTTNRLAVTPRKVLVVIQFTVSITLIIGTILVFRQIQHTKNRSVGYTREGLIIVQKNTPELFNTPYHALRNDLLRTGAVANMFCSSAPSTETPVGNQNFDWKGKESGSVALLQTVGVTHDYGKTMGWTMVEGRDFSRSFPADSGSLILNETAAKRTGLAVGETIRWGGQPHRITGVVKDMVMESPYQPVQPCLFVLDYSWDNFITVRLKPGLPLRDALAQIEPVFKKYNPGSPFNYKFVDQEYARKFIDEERIGKLASVFAVLAIFISCLGLFGLASFTAEQRTKEIGIRKVLGASVFNLWQLLSKDFVILVVVAFFVATPLAYHFLSNWLQKYAYRTEISWWIFAVAGAGALGITLLTVSYQAIKAALMNPVKSLRAE
ncbi:MAG: ABC transporter permease [Cytophagaceae bacterium]|nr:ABC transporter permease [Cytophagaceae bacterium]